MEIHPTALVDPKANLAQDVAIGPYSLVGAHVRLGPGVRIGSHVVLEGHTELGEGCTVFPFAAIGAPPQHTRYQGEPTRVVVGKGTTIREYVTIHRGTSFGGGVTTIGDAVYLMAYVHIAHDCHIGHQVIMANAATLGGHITIGDGAVIGGLVGVHQFVRIGAYAMVGGCSAVSQDVPPFTSVASGNRAELRGLNAVGLRRHGFDAKRVATLKQAYRVLFRSHLGLKEAVKKVREDTVPSQDVLLLLSFLETSGRGISR